jgi:hypothetical protein
MTCRDSGRSKANPETQSVGRSGIKGPKHKKKQKVELQPLRRHQQITAPKRRRKHPAVCTYPKRSNLEQYQVARDDEPLYYKIPLCDLSCNPVVFPPPPTKFYLRQHCPVSYIQNTPYPHCFSNFIETQYF